MRSSVIVLTYNSDAFLEKSLNSIIDSMDKNDELIIIDNDSKDKTKNILKNYSSLAQVYFCNKNIGICEGRNLGAQLAKNDLLVYIDSDIVLSKNALKKAKQSFSKYKAEALFGTYKDVGDGYNWFVEMVRDLFANKRKNNFNREVTLKNFTTFSGGLCLISKTIFLKYSGYDVKYTGLSSEDINLELLMIKNKVRIIFEKDFKATHHKKYLNFKDLVRKYYKNGKSVGNLIHSSKILKYKIPFNRQWPYLPITVPIEILLVILSIFNIIFLIPLLVLLLIRILSVLKKRGNIIKKIRFIYIRFILDIITFIGMIRSLLFGNYNNKLDIDYEVIKYE